MENYVLKSVMSYQRYECDIGFIMSIISKNIIEYR